MYLTTEMIIFSFSCTLVNIFRRTQSHSMENRLPNPLIVSPRLNCNREKYICKECTKNNLYLISF